MPLPLIGTLTSGPAAYEAKTGWPPLLAVIATLVIGAVSLAGAIAAMVALDPQPLSAEVVPDGGLDWKTLLGQLVSQTLVVILVVLAASMLHSTPKAALALKCPAGGPSAIAAGLLVVILVSGSFSLMAWIVRPHDVLSDLTPLWTVMRTADAPLLWIIAAIGAPASEEILFRGFLLSALAQSRLGFIGAALLTNIAWTGLHAGYTMVGLVDVFLFGLVASWLLWRTGSLWVPIIAHAIYNGTLLAVLAQFPVPELGVAAGA